MSNNDKPQGPPNEFEPLRVNLPWRWVAIYLALLFGGVLLLRACA